MWGFDLDNSDTDRINESFILHWQGYLFRSSMKEAFKFGKIHASIKIYTLLCAYI